MRSAIRQLGAVARNRCMLRVLGAWLLFVVNEYSVWVAVLVYAFQRGATSEAAAVAVAQLLPAAILSPLLATVADRRSPSVLLRGGFVGQIGGLGLASAAMLMNGPAAVVYVGAVLASAAVGTTRPALSLVVPGVARSADELSAGNAAMGWLENVGAVLAGSVAGGLLTTGRPAWVLLAGAVSLVFALLLVRPLRVGRLDAAGSVGGVVEPGPVRSLGQVVGLLRRSPRTHALVALVTAGWWVVGALDVLFVVLAVDVLRLGPAWAGFLNMAFGIGGVIAVGVTVLLVGRRLGTPTVAAGLVLAAALAATAADSGVVTTALLITVLGASRSVLEVAATTLLQRTVPMTLVGRMFGLIEGLSMAAMAAGATAVPLLASIGGPRAALLGVAAVVPLTMLACGRWVLRLDDGRRAPLVELSLLRALPQFARMPTPSLERLAAALTRRDVEPGAVVVRQGEGATSFFAVAHGEAAVVVDGAHVATLRRGDGLGGVGTPPAAPHPATVFARTALVLYELEHAAYRRVADAGLVVEAVLVAEAGLVARARAATEAGVAGAGVAGADVTADAPVG